MTIYNFLINKKFNFYMVLKIIITFLLLNLHIFFGFLIILFFPFINIGLRNIIVKLWSSILLKILSIKLSCENHNIVINNNNFFVGNHISWLDIILINTLKPSLFVAKVSIKKWPILGFMIKLSGTIFLNRSSRSSLIETSKKIKHLIKYNSVFIFPEGYATDGSSLNKFHSNFFQVPIDIKKSIYPVAIRYSRNGHFTDASAYIGDDTLIKSIIRIIKANGINAHVIFCKSISSNKLNRKELALKTQEIIKSHLNQD